MTTILIETAKSKFKQFISISAPIKMWVILNVSVISFILCLVDTANILAVFPVPSISHQVVFRPITQELARRGHDVTVITPNPAFKEGQTPPRLKEIDVHDVSYQIWIDHFINASKGKKFDLIIQIELINKLFTDVFDAILQTVEVQKIINDKIKKYDMLLLEACVRPVLGFSHIFKVPLILISSFGAALGNYEMMGASEHPLLYPNILHRKLYNLTKWEKIAELYYHYKLKQILDNGAVYNNEILRKHFGADVPTANELVNNVDLLLLNINPVFDGSHPIPQNIIFMGGIHQNPVKPLPTVSIYFM